MVLGKKEFLYVKCFALYYDPFNNISQMLCRMIMKNLYIGSQTLSALYSTRGVCTVIATPGITGHIFSLGICHSHETANHLRTKMILSNKHEY